MKPLAALIRPLVQSKWLQAACVIIGLLAGLDDAMEAWFGFADMFHLDVSHGLIATALSGVLKPLSDLLDYLGEQAEKGEATGA